MSKQTVKAIILKPLLFVLLKFVDEARIVAYKALLTLHSDSSPKDKPLANQMQ